MSWRARLADVFGIDLRSLALVRIGLAAVLLVDLAVRAGDLRAHYTDFGILPSDVLPAHGWSATLTLHALASPSAVAVGALFGAAALAALALGLGYRTRAATLVSWILVTSLQYRQPALCFGADVMLRMALFFGMFLPLGARFSLDARRHPERAARRNPHVSLASAALLLQIGIVYWFSVLNRDGPTWWEGKALHDALHYDYFASRYGVWLREHEAWLPGMTLVAIWFEGLGPFLAFSPVATAVCRTLAVVLFIGFHATLGLLFNIGLFPAVFSVVWLAFLPPAFWERLGVAGDARADVVSPSPFDRPSRVRDGGVAVAFAFVLASNVSTLRMDPHDHIHTPSPWWDLPARVVHVDQRWGLFAPDPPIYDGWYVMKGRLADGREVNLLEPDRPVGFEKPAVVSETMNIRWREYFFRLEVEASDPRWMLYGDWLCRAWNERHIGGERLARAYVYYVRETTRASGPVREGIETLLAHDCASVPGQHEGEVTGDHHGAPPADVRE